MSASTWLGLVDELLTPVVKVFGDDAVKGFKFQRGIGTYADDLARMKNPTRTVEAFAELSKDLDNPKAYDVFVDLMDKNNNKARLDAINSTLDLAKKERQLQLGKELLIDGEGAAGAFGRGLGRIANRSQAIAPNLGRMVADNVVSAAVFGLPMLGLSMLGSGSSNQNPQLTQEQLAMLTPEELAQYEAMLMQQEY